MKKLFALSAFLLLPTAVFAEEHGTFSTLLENDSFIHKNDRHYTNGLYIAWTGAPQKAQSLLEGVADSVMLPNQQDVAWRTSLFGGQSMYTPENLNARIPSMKDRPYAGWLYAGARVYRDSGDMLDSVEATVGMVGPSSLAADLQQSWHKSQLLGGIRPNGWHHQLHGEPGLVLGEQRIWRVTIADGPLEAELLQEANVRLGNIFTYAGAGATFRIGSGLPSDWGLPRVSPGQSGADFHADNAFGWCVFAGAEGRAVPRNIFLNGSSFEDSPRVSSKFFVADVNAGAALLFPGFRLTASYTARTKEFVGQKTNDQFVSLNVSVAN